MSVYCTLFSQTFYGLLFCYLTITDVHVMLYLQIIDFQFPSCCTSQPPKKLNQIITMNSSTNTPRSYHQKNNSCTLCVPMFFFSNYQQKKEIIILAGHGDICFIFQIFLVARSKKHFFSRLATQNCWLHKTVQGWRFLVNSVTFW